ncbi:putative spermidine/putrescine transport system ATP-binding protein [Aliiroseovarius crassostreae]|uniref:Spermidine/putrescine import ATP-binding protein PotA n=1 Tax=Aliiroseovarius crassostreae TaxID=154981 RepID=A0A0P7I1M3_9RHOB|nr:ABC transporter ATP-binding protein [Aliiroseovarius crassostreae]KPN62809.1 spermidine/putrescine ABC transporter ATP-binding protein [Aliiroseovarius crassostreae]SFU71111.1 putative spermidine/putrescine transport system ATP-binding protein [Aliiroseovarius crassostreae]
MDNFVEFDGIQKTYDGENLVIKDLNLSIAKGEFVTLLGPSGSGKSTALMLLAGFEPPTRGTIRLNGKTLNSVAPFNRNIGMVFQNYALFPHMTVAENVAYPLRVRKFGKSEIEDRARKALDLVQLGSFGARYPKQLSGGQQQRVAVARALVFDPELVLMDEPLGALDKKLREEMQVEIKHIHENLGITMVFVTHDQDEALTMSDRIAVFEDGRIQQIDKPATLYERPANQFVADFIGETNMLPASIAERSDTDVTLHLPTGEVVHATAAGDVSSGTSAVLSVRPERMTINATGAATNALSAKLVETIYHGASAKMIFELTDGSQIVTQLRAGNPLVSMAKGTPAQLSFDSKDARAFATAAAHIGA